MTPRPRNLRRRIVLPAALLLTAACADADPAMLSGPQFHEDGAPPPALWTVNVCKIGPAGTTALFEVTATSGTVLHANPLAVGASDTGLSCVLAWQGQVGVPVTVTVRELPSAGLVLERVSVNRDAPGFTIEGATVTITEEYLAAGIVDGFAVFTYKNTLELAPALRLLKTAASAVVAAGQPMSFTMSVINDGPGTATGVTLQDALPGGAGIQWSVAAADPSCAITGAGSQTLACSFGDLPAGASRSVTVTTATTGAECREYANTASAQASNHSVVTATATAVMTGCPTQCPAQQFALGAAGSFSVFVLNGGDLIMNSSTVWGDVAVGPGSTASTLQKTTINGTLYVHPGASWDNSSAKNFIVTGTKGAVTDLSAAAASANAASAALGAMTPQQTLGNLTTSLTIIGGSGLNVINVESVNFNSRTLTLNGPDDAVFVINVAAGFTFADSRIQLTGGVTAGNVMFNFPTAGPTISLYKATNVIRGTFLAPHRAVLYHNPADFVGLIISRSLNIHSDARLRYPCP